MKTSLSLVVLLAACTPAATSADNTSGGYVTQCKFGGIARLAASVDRNDARRTVVVYSCSTNASVIYVKSLPND